MVCRSETLGFANETKCVAALPFAKPVSSAKAVNPERYTAVREAFATLDTSMFPREKLLDKLRRVDEMQLQPMPHFSRAPPPTS